MSDAQLRIDANTPQSHIERLQESELVFNVIAPIFSILFVTALGLWRRAGSYEMQPIRWFTALPARLLVRSPV